MARDRGSTWHAGFNSGFDPKAIPNLYAWYDMSQETYADATALGAAGTPIHDWSGGGRNLLQATAGNRPTFKTGIVNGKPVMRCVTASLLFCELASFWTSISTSPAEAFCVLKAVSSTPASAVGPYYTVDSGGFSLPDTLGKISDSFGTSSINFTSGVLDHHSAFHIYNPSVALTAGGGQHFLRDGTQLGTVPTIAAIGWSTAVGFRLGSSPSGWFDGDIAEFILYSRKLTAAERLTVNNGLKAKYAIP